MELYPFFLHRRIILLFLVLLTGIAVFISFSSGAYSPQPGNLSYHLVECLVEEYVRWSESRTATLGGVESERRGSLAAGKTAPAGVLVSMMNNHDFDLNELPPEHEQLVQEQPPVAQPELSYSQRLEAAQTRRFEQKELLAKSVALSEIIKKYPGMTGRLAKKFLISFIMKINGCIGSSWATWSLAMCR